MPRRSLSENELKDMAIREQLIGKMRTNKISSEQMADMLGISLNTFYRHRDEPEKLSLRELRIIADIFPDIVIE
jgi:hypothetical protein